MLAACFLAATCCALLQSLGDALDPWSKSSADRSRTLFVDPDERAGLGKGHTALRDAAGRTLWERDLPYTLRDAEITGKGEILGWATRASASETKPQLGLVILEPSGTERAIEWIVDPRELRVRGIVPLSQANRVLFRIEEVVNSWCGTYLLARVESDREEWRSLRLSDGVPIARFVPPVIQREGVASIARLDALRDRPLLCGEAYLGDLKGSVVLLLDLDGREVWRSVETEDWRQPDAYHLWRFSAARLSGGEAAGEFRFQRSRPDELIRWRVESEADGIGPWRVTELAREEHALALEPPPSLENPTTLEPRIVSERRLVSLLAGRPCPVGNWSDAAIDAEGRLLVLEAEDAHLHRFDSQGEPLDTIELREAGKHVNRILGTRKDRFDLAVGDSFATWDGKGERLTAAYGDWHRAFARPANHSIEGARWFLDEHALLHFEKDDPQGAVTGRSSRRPDGTWFGRIDGACVDLDGSLVILDTPPGADEGSGILRAECVLSRFDSQAVGMGTLRLRLGGATSLRLRGGWLAGNAFEPNACFLIDLDAKRAFRLGREFKDWSFRVLLPPVAGEFWIVDLKGKRLLRAALPVD